MRERQREKKSGSELGFGFVGFGFQLVLFGWQAGRGSSERKRHDDVVASA